MTKIERACPLCWTSHAEIMTDLVFGDFDESGLTRHLRLLCCPDCGQVYNEITGGPEALERYYRDQALYSAEMGVGSGGSGPLDLARYARTHEKMAPFLDKKARIADVGCAKGGFLAFLKGQGYQRLIGVDVNQACVDHIQVELGLSARVGSVYRLPFRDGELDVLVLSHVLEHLHNLHGAIQEIRRVLSETGVLFIELPDAGRYGQYPVANYYWLSQREHVNHFDSHHLAQLLQFNGLKVTAAGQMEMEMAPGVENPLIYAVASKGHETLAVTTDSQEGDLSISTRDYLTCQAKEMEGWRLRVKELAGRDRTVYPWGIGLEFFTLYEMAGLRRCNLGWLVDRNPAKVTRTVDGLPIRHPDTLASLGSESLVVLTSVLHKSAMREELERTGFGGDCMVLV
jgi:SAM-dependent methyltransferase